MNIPCSRWELGDVSSSILIAKIMPEAFGWRLPYSGDIFIGSLPATRHMTQHWKKSSKVCYMLNLGPLLFLNFERQIVVMRTKLLALSINRRDLKQRLMVDAFNEQADQVWVCFHLLIFFDVLLCLWVSMYRFLSDLTYSKRLKRKEQKAHSKFCRF